jgi:hypothetical protein
MPAAIKVVMILAQEKLFQHTVLMGSRPGLHGCRRSRHIRNRLHRLTEEAASRGLFFRGNHLRGP